MFTKVEQLLESHGKKNPSYHGDTLTGVTIAMLNKHQVTMDETLSAAVNAIDNRS